MSVICAVAEHLKTWEIQNLHFEMMNLPIIVIAWFVISWVQTIRIIVSLNICMLSFRSLNFTIYEKYRYLILLYSICYNKCSNLYSNTIVIDQFRVCLKRLFFFILFVIIWYISTVSRTMCTYSNLPLLLISKIVNIYLTNKTVLIIFSNKKIKYFKYIQTEAKYANSH